MADPESGEGKASGVSPSGRRASEKMQGLVERLRSACVTGDGFAERDELLAAIAQVPRVASREVILDRARNMVDEIDQIFHDADHWNRTHPTEPRIDPDPDGELSRLRARIARSVPAAPKPPKYWFWEGRKRSLPAQPTLCDYCKEPFGFDELMTRIDLGPGRDCDLVHERCAISPPSQKLISGTQEDATDG